MKINYLSVEGLHGYLSFDLTFFPDLTFLIGINGSGKTSAVRAMMALLTPAVRDLARIEFERLLISITHADQETVVYATRTESEISLGIKGVPERLEFPILSKPSFEQRVAWEQHEIEYYREQEALHARHPVLERLAKIPTPMFLDLERRAQVGIVRRGGIGRPRDHFSSPTLLGGTLLESLVDAQVMAESVYRENQAEQRKLADTLKQDLILTHFSMDHRERVFSAEPPAKDSLRQLRRRQKLINESLNAIGIRHTEIDRTVAAFFEAVYDVVKRLRGRNIFGLLSGNSPDAQLAGRWLALQPQLERVDAVIQHVEKYNASVEKVFRPIQRYLELVNQFLNDSGKTLIFSPTGDLQVALKGEDRWRPITALSSGERQLVVILTHLAFNIAARRANVLIIDEPELSLHIRWQEQFVGALQGASEGLQIVLATHSPSIIMERDAACVDVLEARR